MIVRKEAFKRFLKRLTGAEGQPLPLEQKAPPAPASWRKEISEPAPGPKPVVPSEEETLTRR